MVLLMKRILRETVTWAITHTNRAQNHAPQRLRKARSFTSIVTVSLTLATGGGLGKVSMYLTNQVELHRVKFS